MELVLATAHALLAQGTDNLTTAPGETVASSGATAEAIVFWVAAVIGVGSAVAVILMRNIVHAALMLVMNLVAIAMLYLALQSSFLAIIQILVYAGAIVVLFLFVIMLLGVSRDDLLFETHRWHRVAAGVGGVAVAGLLVFGVAGEHLGAASRCGGQADPAVVAESTVTPCRGLDDALGANEQGSVGIIAERLFTRWTFAFEISALLLVVATIGALVLGRRHDPDASATGPEVV
ncbi:MAG: NADH-quinone oxidoreductase subunit J [Actinobacteria bacterium]|nr:NADH-quinone oxidoreductase subunit J [Actinomycetota bacterium]